MTPIEFNHSFMQPLAKTGGWLFNPEQEKFLYERLNKKPFAELAKTAMAIVEKSKKKPTIAEIIDAFPKEYVGVAKVESGDDKPNYKPYPAKFIRDVVQPAMQEYASGMDMQAWKNAFNDATIAWERENHSITNYRPTSADYRFSEAYFANVLKAIVGGLARNSYSQQNRRSYGN